MEPSSFVEEQGTTVVVAVVVETLSSVCDVLSLKYWVCFPVFNASLVVGTVVVLSSNLDELSVVGKAVV